MKFIHKPTETLVESRFPLDELDKQQFEKYKEVKTTPKPAPKK